MQREREAEREAGSMQEARCGTRCRVFRITPWAAGGTKPLRHGGCPKLEIFNKSSIILKIKTNNTSIILKISAKSVLSLVTYSRAWELLPELFGGMVGRSRIPT